MSPEQARGKAKIDHRSDLFSLGALIRKALTGQAPFRGETAGEILGQVIMYCPAPLGDERPDLPAKLTDLVDKLLSKNSTDRYQKAEEVLAALNELTDISAGNSEAPMEITDEVPPADSFTSALDQPTIDSDRETSPFPRAIPGTLTAWGLLRKPLAKTRSRNFWILSVLLGIFVLFAWAGYRWMSNEAERKLESAMKAQGERKWELATQAETTGRILRDDRVIAVALRIQGDALQRLGRFEEAREALDESRKIFTDLGDRPNVLWCNELLVIGFYYQGDVDGARRLAENYFYEYQAMGDAEAEARLSSNIAQLLVDLDNVLEAMALFERAEKVYSQLELEKEEAQVQGARGIALQASGHLELSLAEYKKALRIFENVDDTESEMVILNNVGECLLLMGQLESARESHAKALAHSRNLGSRSYEAYALFRLGEVIFAKGDWAEAKKLYLEALSSFPEDTPDRARVMLAIARSAIQQGDASKAESAAISAEQVLRNRYHVVSAARAQATLATALIAQGKLEEARFLAESVRERAQISHDPRTRFADATLDALLWTKTLAPEDADIVLGKLRDAEAEASEKGYRANAFELRLTLAAVEIAAGRSAEAKTRLTDLIKETDEAGFKGVRDRAMALRN